MMVVVECNRSMRWKYSSFISQTLKVSDNFAYLWELYPTSSPNVHNFRFRNNVALDDDQSIYHPLILFPVSTGLTIKQSIVLLSNFYP